MAMTRRKRKSKEEPKTYERVKCRFRFNDSGNWTNGTIIVGREGDDGSLTIVEHVTGNMRAIRSEFVQVQKRGPRGGLSWVDYIETVG